VFKTLLILNIFFKWLGQWQHQKILFTAIVYETQHLISIVLEYA